MTALAGCSSKPIVSHKDRQECVVVLHGMGRTAASMMSVRQALQEHGYATVNPSYPSTAKAIEEISAVHIGEYISACQQYSDTVHFVTHSLGGIVLRHYLQTHTLPSNSRIVMLAPPNKGSEISDHYQHAKWYQWSTGKPGQQLTTNPDSLPNRLEPIPYEIGIIAGNRTLEPWFSNKIPGQDDGKVSVESTQLPEMSDFITVPNAHTFMMSSPHVQTQIIHFLQTGQFKATN